MTDTKRIEAPAVVPDGVEYVEPEVRELARGIAAEIREKGHWQAGRICADGSTCIINSKAFGAVNRYYWMTPLIDRLAFLLNGYVYNDAEIYKPITDWNDSTPTADVLARLDAIAEGLVEK